MSGNSKILVTGAGGMLGSNLLQEFSSHDIIGFASQELDISNYRDVEQKLSLVKPDIIIHTAAFTNVDACEEQRDKAYAINTLGTQNLVNYCIGKNVLFIYISSTGVYGTQKDNELYDEFDSAIPTTIHHRSKLEAEKIVSNHLNKYLILRTGWLFGGEVTHQKNFVYKRYLEAKNKTSIKSNPFQIGNPTYIKNLVKQIEILIKEKQYGLFNCVDSADGITRYDYVRKIIKLFDLPCTVEKARADSLQRKAPVSANESAINYKLNLLNLNVMKTWDISLAEYINLLKRKMV